MMTDLAGYRGRITAVYPHLTFNNVKTNDEGMINRVIIVDDAWVFRFPRNDDWAMVDLENEARSLSLARRYLDMALPDMTLHHDEQGLFAAYRFISGRPLQRHHIFSLSTAAQDRLAEQLARFLRQLHTIPAEEVVSHNIPQSLTNRTQEKWEMLYADVKSELFPLLMGYAKEWVEYHFAPVLADSGWLAYDPCFMNGDLGPYHLLYNPKTRLLNGIIDFGTAGIGDPACDFACIMNQYGESFLRRMMVCYPEIEPALDRARFRAGTLELQWLLGGLRSGDNSWFGVHLGRGMDRLPYGANA